MLLFAASYRSHLHRSKISRHCFIYLRNVLFTLSVGFSPLAYCLDYNVNLKLETLHSDNINRGAEDEERDEVEYKAATAFGAKHDNEYLELNLNYNAEISDYKNNVIADNSHIEGTTDLLVKIVDRSIVWDFNHVIVEALANNRERDTPDTRVTRRILTTGPTFTGNITKVDSLALDLEYIAISQNRADRQVLDNPPDENRNNIDSERTQAGLTWGHRLSTVSSFNVNYSQSTTELDDGSDDFEFQRAAVGYAVQLASGRYSIQLGGNRSKRESESDYINGVYTSVEYTNDFGGRVLEIRGIRQLTDSSIGLGADAADVNNNNFNDLDIVERTNIVVSYQYDNICQSCSWKLTYLYDEEDFEEGASTTQFVQDSTEHSIESALTYKINSRASTFFLIRFRDASFDGEDRDDNGISLEAALNYKFAGNLDLRINTEYDDRDTSVSDDTLNPVDLDYQELSFGLAVIYTFR